MCFGSPSLNSRRDEEERPVTKASKLTTVTLPAGRRKQIHTYAANIKDQKSGGDRSKPMFAVRYNGKLYLANHFVIDPGRTVEAVASADDPLQGGTIAYLQTSGALTLHVNGEWANPIDEDELVEV